MFVPIVFFREGLVDGIVKVGVVAASHESRILCCGCGGRGSGVVVGGRGCGRGRGRGLWLGVGVGVESLRFPSGK